MAVEGSLQEMSLPTLVQLMLHERGHVCIRLQHAEKTGWLYLEDGTLCHAALTDSSGGSPVSSSSEEVVYALLGWSEGSFVATRNVAPPERSINRSWDQLLLEGLRRQDKQKSAQNAAAGKRKKAQPAASKQTSLEMAASNEPASDKKENLEMANLKESLQAVMEIDGAIAAALVDWESGLTLGTIGEGFNIDLAAAGNTNVVRAKLKVMKDLGLKGSLEDILITLSEQYHLIRMMHDRPNLFLYVSLKRSSANLGMARYSLSSIEENLEI